MLKKKADEIPWHEVTMADSKKTNMQWLISSEDGAENFAMRRFKIEEGGSVGLHAHPEEHEIFVLSGRARVFTDKEEILVKPGDTLFVSSNELHGYEARENEPFVFLCVIPILK